MSKFHLIRRNLISLLSMGVLLTSMTQSSFAGLPGPGGALPLVVGAWVALHPVQQPAPAQPPQQQGHGAAAAHAAPKKGKEKKKKCCCAAKGRRGEDQGSRSGSKQNSRTKIRDDGAAAACEESRPDEEDALSESEDQELQEKPMGKRALRKLKQQQRTMREKNSKDRSRQRRQDRDAKFAEQDRFPDEDVCEEECEETDCATEEELEISPEEAAWLAHASTEEDEEVVFAAQFAYWQGQQAALDEQEAALDEQEAALDEQEAALDEQEAALDEQEAALDEQAVNIEEEYHRKTEKW